MRIAPPPPPKPKQPTATSAPPPLKPRPDSSSSFSSSTSASAANQNPQLPPRPASIQHAETDKPSIPQRPKLKPEVPPRPKTTANVQAATPNIIPQRPTPPLPFRPPIPPSVDNDTTRIEKFSVVDEWHPALMKLKSVPKSPIDYTTYDFSDVDNHAISCPDYEQRSISRLSAYLTSPFPDALCKIRAVFTWIADNVEYNYNGFLTGNMGAQDADSILHSRSSVCDGYSNLFLALCEAAPRFEGHEEIYAFKISGLARGVNLEAGDTVTDLNGHAWNSVYVNGEYRFIESTWAAGSAEGNSFKKLFLPIPYFLAAPELFIYTHIPSKGDSQQYLPEPLTHQEWLQLPHTGPAYRINGMRLLSATGLKPTSHNMLSFIETDDDYMELRIELSANLDVSTGGCRIIGHICPGVSGPPMILYPNAVARLPNAPHSDQLKASPSVPTSAMMFHWDEVLDDRNKRIAVFRGYLPRGESVIRVMAQMSSDSEHCYQAIQFRVCNHGSGRRHPPPVSFGLVDMDGVALEPLEGVLAVGQRVRFVARGRDVAIVVTPKNQVWEMRREGHSGNQALEVTVDCIGKWYIGFKHARQQSYAYCAMYEALK